MADDRQGLILVWTFRVCVVVAAAMAAFAFLRLRAPVEKAVAMVTVESPDFVPSPHVPNEAWGAFAPLAGATAGAGAGEVAKSGRFRLAGTFFVLGGTNEVRKAILDDSETKQQMIVGQGEQVAGFTVAEVGVDRAVLVRGAEREVLTMGFAAPKLASKPMGTNAVPLETGETVLDETPFGKRVGDTRWVMSRDALMKYYQDLLESPERIAALYESLKPEYNGDDIAGYRLNQEGEQEMFKALGFKEGDVVRKVNSMLMTSQARAEYFLSEFVKDRLGAAVIDIERDGKPEKLIYLIR